MSGENQPFTKVGAREVYVRTQRDIAGDYVRERAYGKLGENKVIVQRLQNTLTQAVLNGESIPKIATRIKAVAETNRRQAVTIARTETTRVVNQGRMTGFTQARDQHGIKMKKRWIATADARTRPDHVYLDGETAELDEPFSNGLMQPGDVNGPPEQVVNCRCVTVGVLAGFDEAWKVDVYPEYAKEITPGDGEAITQNLSGSSMFPDDSKINSERGTSPEAIIETTIHTLNKNTEDERLKTLTGASKIKTTGIPADVLYDINNELEVMYKEYPQLKSAVQRVYVTNDASAGIMEHHVQYKKGNIYTSLVLNSNDLKDTATINKIIEDNVNSGHWTPKNGVGGIVRHEMAHALEFVQTYSEHGVDFTNTDSNGIIDRYMAFKAYDRGEVADRVVHQALGNLGMGSADWNNYQDIQKKGFMRHSLKGLVMLH